MSLITSNDFVFSLIRAWTQRGKGARILLGIAVVFGLGFFAVTLLHDMGIWTGETSRGIGASLGIAGVVFAAVVAIYQKHLEALSVERKIERIEERVLANPEKPQLAWDLARAKLESYLDRNLSQVRSIFWLTFIVMAAGFGFVLFGLLKAFDSPDKLPVSIVASASGVITSFIGGSFLLIYRSILSQSKDYVTVLERINAVGMAVQVIASIPEENSSLKHSTTAELAKQLLGLYASDVSVRKETS